MAISHHTASPSFSSKYASQALVIDPPSLREITFKVQAVGGINLGQGVCQLPVPEILLAEAEKALRAGVNRYTSPRGLGSLREAIAKKLAKHNGLQANPDTEVLVTSGSTGGFEGVCATLINPGDEVVSFSPFYPYHNNTLVRFGAKVRYVELTPPTWSFSLEQLSQAFSERTKFVVVNTPANPSGKVFTRAEIESIGRLCERYDALLVTDEIYEYMVYDGHPHISPATVNSLSQRTITIGGYSKTFAITGWRIGYVVLPAEIAHTMTAMLDSIYICAPAPLQEAVAQAILGLDDNFYQALQQAYLKKRNFLSTTLAKVGLRPYLPDGAYYMMVDYSELFPKLRSEEFVDFMIKKVQVGAVPAKDFVLDSSNERWVRLCFAVPDDVLEKAASQIAMLAQ